MATSARLSGVLARGQRSVAGAAVRYGAGMSELPLHGVPVTRLEPEPLEATSGLEQAQALAQRDPAAGRRQLRAVVADAPAFLGGWAQLAEWSLEDGLPVDAYALARTGYHRGLDRIRSAGWRGQGPVPWSHEPNQGFLRSVRALMQAAQTIGETVEAVRCRNFLLQLDPDDAQAVAAVPHQGQE